MPFDPGLESLLGALRAAGIAVGVDEVARLRQVFSLAPALDRAGLARVLAGVLLKRAEDRPLFDAIYARWVDQAAALLGPTARREVGAPPPWAGLSAKETGGPGRPEASAAGGRLRLAVVAAVVAAAIAAVPIASRFLGGAGPHEPGPLPDAAPRRPADAGPSPSADAGPGPDSLVLPPVSAARLTEAPAWMDAAVPTLRDVGGGPGPWPALALAAIGLGGAAVLAGLGRRRSWLPPPAPAPRRAGPPRFQLRGGTAGFRLLDARDEEALAWGVGRFVSEEPSDRLDVDRSVAETAAAAGRPALRFLQARQQREVWIWVDEASDTPAASRLAAELTVALERVGLPVERATFWGIPDRLLGDKGTELSPNELDERRDSAVVAILTDGRLLALESRAAHRRAALDALLRSLSNWPQLAVVDFSAGAYDLAAVLGRHEIRVLPPEQAAGALATLAQATSRGGGAEAELSGDGLAWAAACALSPYPIDEETAFGLRDALRLNVSPWAIEAVRAAAEPRAALLSFAGERRAQLLAWLVDAELLGDDGAVPAGGLLDRALGFWDAAYASAAAARTAREAVEPWQGTPAEQHMRMERALVALWRDPDEAARELYRLGAGPGPLAETVRGQLAALAPAEAAPRPGVVRLPWRLADRPADVRVALGAMGFGAAAGVVPGRLRWPGRLWLAIGLCAGLGLGGAGLAARHWARTAGVVVRAAPAALGVRTFVEPAGGPAREVIAVVPWGRSARVGVEDGATVQVGVDRRQLSCRERAGAHSVLVRCAVDGAEAAVPAWRGWGLAVVGSADVDADAGARVLATLLVAGQTVDQAFVTADPAEVAAEIEAWERRARPEDQLLLVGKGPPDPIAGYRGRWARVTELGEGTLRGSLLGLQGQTTLRALAPAKLARVAGGDIVVGGVDRDLACDAGDLGACREKADSHPRTDDSQVQRLLLYRQACRGGDYRACASLFVLRNAIPADQLVDVLGEACHGGHVDACLLVAWAYESGRGVRASPATAVTIYRAVCLCQDFPTQANCERRRAEACLRRGRLLLRLGQSQSADVATSFAMACGQGNGPGCTAAGRAAEARGDDAAAVSLYDLACARLADAEGCYLAGRAYAEGHGVPRSVPGARVRLRTACSLGYRAACNGTPAAVPPPSVESLTTTCQRGEADACVELRRRRQADCKRGEACAELARLLEDGVGGPADAAEAEQLYRRACDGGDQTACGRVQMAARPPPGADLPALDDACNGRDAASCVKLGDSYRARGGSGDGDLALSAFRRGCDRNYAPACRLAAELAPQPDTAKLLRQRACALGDDAKDCPPPDSPK